MRKWNSFNHKVDKDMLRNTSKSIELKLWNNKTISLLRFNNSKDINYEDIGWWREGLNMQEFKNLQEMYLLFNQALFDYNDFGNTALFNLFDKLNTILVDDREELMKMFERLEELIGKGYEESIKQSQKFLEP
jgi:anaerobic ribonucleoside-triphosphate reductase